MVYGFFGLIILVPVIRNVFGGSGFSIIAGGIILAVMILPTIVSISANSISSVPSEFREASLSLGADRRETIMKVVLPAAKSGIFSSVILGMGRAIGETMIVTIASGSSKNFTFDITQSMQTMTAYIVEFTSGDAGSGTVGYYSLYAVGLILFIFTLIMNLGAQYISRKYREEY